MFFSKTARGIFRFPFLCFAFDKNIPRLKYIFHYANFTFNFCKTAKTGTEMQTIQNRCILFRLLPFS